VLHVFDLVDFDDPWAITTLEQLVLSESSAIASHGAFEVNDIALATAKILPELRLGTVTTHLKACID
jgi:hypothetical protein